MKEIIRKKTDEDVKRYTCLRDGILMEIEEVSAYEVKFSSLKGDISRKLVSYKENKDVSGWNDFFQSHRNNPWQWEEKKEVKTEYCFTDDGENIVSGNKYLVEYVTRQQYKNTYEGRGDYRFIDNVPYRYVDGKLEMYDLDEVVMVSKIRRAYNGFKEGQEVTRRVMGITPSTSVELLKTWNLGRQAVSTWESEDGFGTRSEYKDRSQKIFRISFADGTSTTENIIVDK